MLHLPLKPAHPTNLQAVITKGGAGDHQTRLSRQQKENLMKVFGYI